MSDLTKIFLTSGLTICGGVLVLVVGQFLMKLFIEPLFALRSHIGEIADCLIHYAHIYANPGSAGKELMQEAKDALRQKASILQSRAYSLPFYTLFALFRLVPSKDNISQASGKLIALSNSVFDGNPLWNHDFEKSIRSALHLPKI
jgi:hypothetical protein